MPATYKSIVTTLGQAKIATAIANNSTVNLYEMAVGDGNGNATTPDVAQTSLVREKYRAQLNTLTVDPQNPNYVIAELVVPSSVGGWTVREVGVFDNAGALIVVANFPDTYKPVIAEGSTRDLVVRIIIEVAEADVLTLTIDPSVVLASRQWVSDNFSLAVQIPGGTTGMVLRKASNADGDVEWYDPVSGQLVIVDVVEENQTLAAAQTVVTLTTATTNGAVVYIDGVRLRDDEWSATAPDTAITITLAEAYADGSRITIVQNEPLSSGDFLRTANRLSEIAGAGTVAQESARVNLGLPANGTTGMIQAVMQAIYRVGSLYTTTETGNPNTLLGFGTWARFGEGRALVGFNAADSDFNAVEKTGGAKTHTLIAAEIPAHAHTIDPPATNTSSNGDHAHTFAPDTTAAGPAGGGFIAGYGHTGTATTGTAGAHTHTLDIPQFNSGSVGSGQAHNNLQPYIVVNLWKRVS